jgi:hypothetical protein
MFIHKKNLSLMKVVSPLPEPHGTSGISKPFFFLFPVVFGGGGFLQNLRIIRAGKTFFWGRYFERNRVNHPKKVFPAGIMHFAENPRNHKIGEQEKEKSLSAFSPITRFSFALFDRKLVQSYPNLDR